MIAQWMIISWQHNDSMDGQFGQVIDHIIGTEDEAIERAKQYLHCSPVGIVREITATTNGKDSGDE